MTLPLNKKQKQLVEKSMDLVPIMIRSMTRTAAYVTEEEQQELCQIGYLALCRSAVGFEEGRSFQPYAKTIIRHAIFDYWRKIARDRSMNSRMPIPCARYRKKVRKAYPSNTI